LSYDSPKLYDLKVDVKLENLGLEEVTILGENKSLFLIQETLINNYLGWEYTNHYWVDEQFFTWKSIQTISSKLPPFQIEVTKKPAG